MKLLSIASSISIVFWLASFVNAKSIELRPGNIQERINSGTWLIEHFAPYCPHCQHFAPVWKKLSDDLDYLATESDFHFGTIDCTVYGDLCAEHGILGYPTVQLWHNGENVERYNDANSYEPLMEYIMKRVNGPSQVEVTEEDPEKALEEEEGSDEMVEAAEEEEEGPEEMVEVVDEELEETLEEERLAPVSLVNAEGISVNLDGEQLKKISENRVPWFVKFYAPWCGHCKNLAPTWIEMATQLKGQVNVGEVDCVALPAVCEQYNIRGFPTLKMFGHGEPVLFEGDRSLVSLIKFANAYSGPTIKEVDSDALNQHLSAKEVALVYLYKGNSPTQQVVPELIETIADQYSSSISAFSTQDERAFKKFNLAPTDLPALLIVKDNDYQIYSGHDLSDNIVNREALIQWIDQEQYPLVSKLNPSNYQTVLQAPLPAVLHLVDGNDNISQKKFRDIATAWKSFQVKTEAVFAEMDRAMWKDYALEKFGVNAPNTVILYDAPNHIYYVKDLNGLAFSIENPEHIYLALKNIGQLSGQSTLLLHQKMGNTFSWVFRHWFISFIAFGVLGSFVYRYLTFHRPKRLHSVLPTFRTMSTNGGVHKD